MVTLKKKTSYQRSWRAAEMQSEIALGVRKKKNKQQNTEYREDKNQRTENHSGLGISGVCFRKIPK